MPQIIIKLSLFFSRIICYNIHALLLPMFRNRDILAYSEAILFLLTRLVYWSLVEQFRRLELYNIRNQKHYKSMTTIYLKYAR